jgi:hypothetical protein
MFFSSWLRKPNAKPRTGRRANVTFRPRLEVLEGRDVPSTLTVTNTLDSGTGSLRYEIAQAQSNDTIVFNFGKHGHINYNNYPHTITLSSGNELFISKNLTIEGPGAGLLKVTSGPSTTNSRIFEVAATVTLSGLTISNGGGIASFYFGGSPGDGNGGGILNDPSGALTISGCTLTGNSASYGGAIYNQGTLTVSSCTLSNNSAGLTGSGGSIYNANALTVSGCTLSANSAGLGGGIYNAGWATVSASTLSANSATGPNGFGLGGGIYNAGPATVSGCTLSDDSATSGGGGIYNAWTLTVSNSIFSSNTPDNITGPYTDGGGNTSK